MAAPAPEHVRNIVLVGQDGAGKTSLAEAMLFVSGKTPRMGTTHDGKSYLDYDPEEIKRKFTISTSIAPIPYKDYKINVLDTSGHPDFIGDTLATMQAAEMALFVVDAVDGPQVMTTKLWREAEDMRLSRAVYINHIDRENANFDAAMALLHARFGGRLGAVTIPIGQAEEFQGVIDIIRMEARYFEDGGERVEAVDTLPAKYQEEARIARDKTGWQGGWAMQSNRLASLVKADAANTPGVIVIYGFYSNDLHDGLTDTKPATDLSKIAAAYKAKFDELKAKYPQARILYALQCMFRSAATEAKPVMTGLPAGTIMTNNFTALQSSERILFTETTLGVPVIDATDEVWALGSGLTVSDMIHPTAEGAVKLGQILGRHIKQAIQQ